MDHQTEYKKTGKYFDEQICIKSSTSQHWCKALCSK